MIVNEDKNLRAALIGILSAALGFALFGKVGLIAVLLYYVAKKM